MRPSSDLVFMFVAKTLARRSTCIRREVGCVLVNSRRHILSTGYNGVAAGMPHCNEGHPCSGADAASGTKLELCEAIHAEQNALLQCPDVQAIDTCFVTASPCIHCIKLLLNTSCKRIVYEEEYSREALLLWSKAGRQFKQHG